jgi:hypothetical protein
MNRRHFVVAVTVSLAGCSSPEDDDGTDDEGGGPYGRVDAPARSAAP